MVRKTFVSTWGVLAAVTIGSLLYPVQATPRPQQQPSTSVAEAARKAREQKKNQQAGKVYTNDDIENLKGTVSVVGTPPAAPPAADATAKPPETPAAATPDKAAAAPGTASQPQVKDEAYWRKTFAEARKKLAGDSKELDILQREYNLKQQQYYTDPNAALREQNNRKDLNDTLQQINTKKQAVEQDKQAISSLEDDLRKSGGDPGWSREP